LFLEIFWWYRTQWRCCFENWIHLFLFE